MNFKKNNNFNIKKHFTGKIEGDIKKILKATKTNFRN